MVLSQVREINLEYPVSEAIRASREVYLTWHQWTMQ